LSLQQEFLHRSSTLEQRDKTDITIQRENRR